MRHARFLCILALGLAGCPDLPEVVPVDTTEGIGGEGDAVDSVAEEILTELPPCSYSVLNAFSEDEVQPPGAASGGWMPPEDDTISAIEGSIDALLNGEPLVAVGQTAVVGYTMCRGNGDEGQVVLWRPAWPGTGRALFAWRVGAANDVIIEAPHAWASPATMEQAITLFQASGARALIAGGSHPCSNTDSIGCGSDSVCGGGQALASDASRNEATVFQLAHRVIADHYPDSWIVSLQPMDAEGVSVSDGTLGEAQGGSAVEAVGLALADALAGEPVTSCNPYIGAVVEARACGTESVQARYLDGANDVCSGEPVQSTGRYVQLSQSPAVQQRVLTVADALATALSTR